MHCNFVNIYPQFYVNYVQLRFFNVFFFRGNFKIVECWINDMENLFIGKKKNNQQLTCFSLISP